MEQGRCEERIIDLFLESAADSVAWAVQVNEYEAASEMIKEISDFVEKHSELFFLENERRKIQMARFYMNAMLRFGSVYIRSMRRSISIRRWPFLGSRILKNIERNVIRLRTP